VHDTTSTSLPSATYLAMVAAPLLDSSSGWACTAMSRSVSTRPPAQGHARQWLSLALTGSNTHLLTRRHDLPRKALSPCRCPVQPQVPPDGGSSAPSASCSDAPWP